MDIFYNNEKYSCNIKCLLKKGTWSNMWPIKLNTVIPISVRENILKSKDNFSFIIKKEANENLPFRGSENNIEYWEVSSILESATISSQYKNSVRTHFKLNIYEERKLEKSEIRDIVLSEIIT